ncbi:MAG: Ig-like domain-containing protein [Candidatus Neomarinimicrobiota bacterium]
MRKHFIILIGLLVVTSCDDSKTDVELIPDSINISSSYSIIKPEQQIQLKVQVLTADNDKIDDIAIIWTSDNESVAIVNEKGVVTGKGQGTTYIIATAGNVQNSIEITVSAIRRRILSELFTSST